MRGDNRQQKTSVQEKEPTSPFALRLRRGEWPRPHRAIVRPSCPVSLEVPGISSERMTMKSPLFALAFLILTVPAVADPVSLEGLTAPILLEGERYDLPLSGIASLSPREQSVAVTFDAQVDLTLLHRDALGLARAAAARESKRRGVEIEILELDQPEASRGGLSLGGRLRFATTLALLGSEQRVEEVVRFTARATPVNKRDRLLLSVELTEQVQFERSGLAQLLPQETLQPLVLRLISGRTDGLIEVLNRDRAPPELKDVTLSRVAFVQTPQTSLALDLAGSGVLPEDAVRRWIALWLDAETGAKFRTVPSGHLSRARQ